MATRLSPEQFALVNKIRDVCSQRSTISVLQEHTTSELPVKEPSWVFRQTFRAPTDGSNTVSQIVYNAIEAQGVGNEKVEKILIQDVDVRWTGYREGVAEDQPEAPPGLSDKQKYDLAVKDVKHPVTIFYIHGGAFYLNTPHRYHSTTAKLAQLTGGRCVSFRYRLSPKHTFPAALLDALFTYLSLLYPAPGQFHEPVPASSIVFAGDSAGANLVLALTQVIMSAVSRGEKVRFNGKLEEVPLPAGVTLLSPGLDMTHAIITKENAKFDIWDGSSSFLETDYPSCSLWPSSPPRGHIYADQSILAHPIVSPALANSWKGAPPIWIGSGQEVLAGCARLVVQVIAQEGGSVVYEEYAEMPHDFPIMKDNWTWASTQNWPQSIQCMDHWAKAALTFYEGTKVKTEAVFIEVNGDEKPLELELLSGSTWEQASEIAKRKIESWKDWTGTQEKEV